MRQSERNGIYLAVTHTSALKYFRFLLESLGVKNEDVHFYVKYNFNEKAITVYFAAEIFNVPQWKGKAGIWIDKIDINCVSGPDFMNQFMDHGLEKIRQIANAVSDSIHLPDPPQKTREVIELEKELDS